MTTWTVFSPLGQAHWQTMWGRNKVDELRATIDVIRYVFGSSYRISRSSPPTKQTGQQGHPIDDNGLKAMLGILNYYLTRLMPSWRLGSSLRSESASIMAFRYLAHSGSASSSLLLKQQVLSYWWEGNRGLKTSLNLRTWQSGHLHIYSLLSAAALTRWRYEPCQQKANETQFRSQGDNPRFIYFFQTTSQISKNVSKRNIAPERDGPL